MTNIKEPLVSVIIPIYNVESYIEACMESVKQQSYKNLEIIAVEDCSIDSSLQVFQPHLEDKRIKLIKHEKNRGLSAARNTGIAAATGEYMMFVDSDDIVDTHLVAACVDCALKNNAEVVTYGFVPFKDGIADIELPYPSIHLKLTFTSIKSSYFELPHFACLKFIRSSIIRSASLEFPVGLYYEDWPFHWHLGLSTSNRFHLPVNFYLYRQRGTSITGSRGKELLDLFTIHSQVNDLLPHNEDDEIKEIFVNKVRQSHWSILTRIESKYLDTALRKAKEAEKSFELNEYKSDANFRSNIISKIVSMPDSIALYSLKLLRKALHRKAQFRKK